MGRFKLNFELSPYLALAGNGIGIWLVTTFKKLNLN